MPEAPRCCVALRKFFGGVCGRCWIQLILSTCGCCSLVVSCDEKAGAILFSCDCIPGIGSL